MVSTIKIFSWGNIGDAILLTPCLKALKKERPESKLILYYRDAAHRDVYLHNPYIDLLADRATATATPLGYERVYEPAIGYQWPNTLYKVNASSIMAELLDTRLDDDRPELFLTSEEIKRARQTVMGLRRPLVAIHPSSTFDYKEWDPERWEELVRRNHSRCSFLQLGMPADRAIEGVIDLRGTPLRDSFAILRECDALCGVDSALAHAAAAIETPAIVLFGASSPAVFGHKENINLYQAVSCSPCLDILHYGKCPLGRVCMKGISVEAVDQALGDLLEKHRGHPDGTFRSARDADDDLLASHYLTSNDFALTFDWDGEPTLYSFQAPEHNIRISETVRVLLSCFPGNRPLPVREAVQTFLKRGEMEPGKNVIPGVLAAIRELIELRVLVKSREKPPLYSPEMVEHYSRARSIPQEIPATIADAAQVRTGTSILDIGSGVGTIANRLAEDSDDVTGLDISEPFLEVARSTAASRGLRAHFQSACGNKLVLNDVEYDLIVISQAFHWLDSSFAVRGIYQALRPGGLLYVLESKPVLPAANPLKAVLGHGCPDREFVRAECGRHAQWYSNLFEALKPPAFLMKLTHTWIFHQRRPFDRDYARAFFFNEALRRSETAEDNPWDAIDNAFRCQSREDVMGDMYWFLMEFEKVNSARSPFEQPPGAIAVDLDNAIEIPEEVPVCA